MTLTVDEMIEIVAALEPAPGWHLQLTPTPPEWHSIRGRVRLSIQTDKVPNTRYEGREDFQPPEVSLYMPRYPPVGVDENRDTFLAWVVYEYMWLQLHEALEWLRWRDGLEPVIDPHASEHTATRLLPPRPGEEWWGHGKAVRDLMRLAQLVIDEEYREDIDFRPLQEAIDRLREEAT